MTPPHNPYAPPRAPPPSLQPGVDGNAPIGDYTAKRQSVVLCVVLGLVTGGLYPSIWLWRRRAFFNTLRADVSLGAVGPAIYLVANAGSLALAFFGRDGAEARGVLTGVAALAGVISAFRVVRILRSDFRRTGRMLDVSYLMAFFFGAYYLQYKINQGADRPARISAATPD